MATFPIFIAHIQCVAPDFGCHAKKMKGYPAIPRTTGEHLRKRRLELDRTQEDMAEQFGVSVTSYNKWEGDQHCPAVKYWPAITDFLGHDPTPGPASLDEALTALQRRHGLGRMQLAIRLGIERKSLLNWLSAKTAPLPSLRNRVLASGLPGAEILRSFI